MKNRKTQEMNTVMPSLLLIWNGNIVRISLEYILLLTNYHKYTRNKRQIDGEEQCQTEKLPKW